MTPGYSTAAVGTAVVAFAVGIAIGAMMSGGCCGWGYSSWNCGWHGATAVVYRGGAYYGNTAWRGLPTAPTAPRTTALAIIRPPGLTPVEVRSRTAMAARARAGHTIHRPELMHGVLAPQMPTAPQAPRKRTTREPGVRHPRSRTPMPTGAQAPRRSRRTATPHTRSTNRTLTEAQAP